MLGALAASNSCLMKFFSSKNIIVIISLLTFSESGYSQLSVKDFKLCLDNAKCIDTVLLITKDQLMKSKKIIPNFSWFTIASSVIYIGEGNYTSEMTVVNMPGDSISDEARRKFERLRPGMHVTIDVKGYNKQKIEVQWGLLTMKIVE